LAAFDIFIIARLNRMTQDSGFIRACTAKLVAKRHLAALRFSDDGETATSPFGVSERSRSISVAQ